MATFFSYFTQMLLLLCLPPFLFGFVAFGAHSLYGMLVGEQEGRPLLLAVSALSTPLRELGHVIACVICLHRIEDVRFLNIHDPDGEWGYVEHSYNPRNPLAILGNFLYALGPVATGLSAVLIIFSLCFYGVLPPFFSEIEALNAAGAGFTAYVKAAVSLIPAMFTVGGAPMVLRILGCALLLAVCFGIYISFSELKDALGGFAVFAVLAALATGVLMLFDDRVMRIAFGGIRAYATGVTALFSVVLLCFAVLLIVGLVFRTFCTLFSRSEDDQSNQIEGR